jgi:hypothetical protein
MKTQDIISIRQFCKLYEIPDSFIDSLCSYELLDITIFNDEMYISKSQIRDIEKMIHLHYELKINFEGLDVILNLLEQISTLQREVNELKNKLDYYTQE